ncbi:hypothetical protein IEQ34_005268 [Dendrobium chrysotoxum]|uniref:Uncharacterized protein n=1 Tax=Dendrobium chrysotoxum TaxID=161865 RepID=A0AAV7GTG5_DENCH|nr:hypothetical protein IEQ34_005268 [Dendrobium chrysotoxum]
MAKGCSHHASHNDGERWPNKGAKLDDVASIITGDSLIVLHKKFHFPNNMVARVPKRSDRTCLPHLKYLTIYETSLRAGAISVIVGLIAPFRDRGAVLTPEHLSWMGQFTSNTQGCVIFRSKWLDMRTRDQSKSWPVHFFL